MTRGDAARRREHALSLAKRLALSIKGIQGVDFGLVYREGMRTSKRGLRFHVERKRSPGKLSPDQLLPTAILGIPCDVIQANYQPHNTSPRSPFDPIRPGISIGNLRRQTTGTLGNIVYDAARGTPCVLSNWHVLCGSTVSVPGEEIIQPGPRHLGSEAPRKVAELLRWANPGHGYDAAIAAIGLGVAARREILTSNLVVSRAREPKINMRVVKSGVSSGFTHAIVDGVGGSFQMDYRPYNDKVRWMDGIRLVPDPDQMEDEISLGGDSGALWVEAATGMGVALHFGGEDDLGPLAEYAVAHPLPRVLELLDITLHEGSV